MFLPDHLNGFIFVPLVSQSGEVTGQQQEKFSIGEAHYHLLPVRREICRTSRMIQLLLAYLRLCVCVCVCVHAYAFVYMYDSASLIK